MTDTSTAVSGDRLAHLPERFAPGEQPDRVRALVLTAEGPRRSDLIAWAGAHRQRLAGLRLLAPPGVGALLQEKLGLVTEPLRAGTVGPTATAGLAAAGVIDGVVAFSDPLELRPGDTTTRALMRLAVFWDIPIAGNRATADLLLSSLTPLGAPAAPAAPQAPVDAVTVVAGDGPHTRGTIRLWHVRATVDDVPGRLAILAASLARRSVNILSVQVHLTADGPVDELLVAASPVLSASDLAAAVTDGGARLPRVEPADAHALVDPPTRSLGLAARLLRNPDDLPTALAELLGGAQISWRPEEPGGVGDTATQLWLDDPTGGGFLASRPTAPFTPAESARAHALVDVAVAALSSAPQVAAETWRMMLADGAEVTVRRATPDDLDAVVALHARCSLTTRLRRYLAGTNCPSHTVLAQLLHPSAGHSLVAEDTEGRVVAMANLMWTDGTAELAMLVEDGWQNRRLGTAMARRLAAVAAETGLTEVHAMVHPGNASMIRIMSAIGRRLHREYDGGTLTLIAHLDHRGERHTQRLPSHM
ncbi:GNAT family N-acetyltransferase [Luedemannella helvata]|uniref:N-acetyltransferase domain-containing protein n=1 Tax=Luedemannella helvata TaxID=349315 RepID=A0ABN2K1J1_9ACTN